MECAHGIIVIRGHYVAVFICASVVVVVRLLYLSNVFNREAMMAKCLRARTLFHAYSRAAVRTNHTDCVREHICNICACGWHNYERTMSGESVCVCSVTHACARASRVKLLG